MRPGMLWPLMIIHSVTEKGVETHGAIHPGRETRTKITIAPNKGDFRTGIRLIEGFKEVCSLMLVACLLRSLIANYASTGNEWSVTTFNIERHDVPN